MKLLLINGLKEVKFANPRTVPTFSGGPALHVFCRLFCVQAPASQKSRAVMKKCLLSVSGKGPSNTC